MIYFQKIKKNWIKDIEEKEINYNNQKMKLKDYIKCLKIR